MMDLLPDQPELISVAQAMKRLGVGEKAVRRQFELVRIGSRTLVRVADVRRLVKGE